MQGRHKRILYLMVGISVGITAYRLAGIAAPVSAAAQSKEQLEIEKGRETVGQACVQCHNLRGIQTQRKSAEMWRDTVYSMIGRGGLILPEEIEPIITYLVANFGPSSPPPSFPTQTAGSTRSASGTLEQQLPEAEGKSILLRNCQQCHGFETVIARPRSPDDWTKILNRMVAYGMKLTQVEQKKLIEYLVRLTQSQERR